MIIATYLPIFRVHELEIFKKNFEIASADSAIVCIDYYFNERQDELYRGLLRDLNVELIKGNWRNRSSCLLRLVRRIAEVGDGVVVDSDVLLPEGWRLVDAKLDLPFYHISHDVWRHRRVTRRENRGGVDVYYWKVKDVLSRTMHVFAGPKLAIRYKERIKLRAVEEVLSFIDSADTYYSGILADEIALGVVYDKSGIEEVPFIPGAIHLTHGSYPSVNYDERLHKCIYSRALQKFYMRFGYLIPSIRYALTRIINCI